MDCGDSNLRLKGDSQTSEGKQGHLSLCGGMHLGICCTKAFQAVSYLAAGVSLKLDWVLSQS